MVDTLRVKIARFFAPRHYEDFDNRVNARVALLVSRLDPFEPLMKSFHGVFGEDFEKPERRLDTKSTLLLTTLAYQLRDDPSFKYLLQWIMNSQGNQMLNAPARTNEERGEVLMWGKAQISGMIFLKKELNRLASLYEEMLGKDKEGPPDPGTSVEL